MTRTTEDRVRFWRNPLPGIDVLRARFGGHAFDRHAHDTYSIAVTQFGRQVFHHRGRRNVSTSGTIIAMNPDEAHDGEAGDAEGFAYWMLYPTAEAWRGMLTDAGGGRGEPPFFPDTLIDDPGCARRLVQLCRTLTDPDCSALETETAAMQALVDLAGRHGRAAPPAAAQARDPRIRRVRDLLHDGYDRDIRLDDLAREAGCSRFRVSRAFAAAYGLPPHAYLTRRRLEVARDLLVDGEPAAEIATAVGFVDQSHLIRRFKASYGITPGEFQAACTGVQSGG